MRVFTPNFSMQSFLQTKLSSLQKWFPQNIAKNSNVRNTHTHEKSICWVNWPFLHVEHGNAWVGSIAAQQHERILTLCLRMWPWTDLRKSHPQLNRLHTLEDFDAYWADRKRSSAETVQAARTRLRKNPARCARFIALFIPTKFTHFHVPGCVKSREEDLTW